MIWKGRRLGETPSAHIIGPAPKNNALNAGDDNCTYDDRKVILVKLFLCFFGKNGHYTAHRAVVRSVSSY